MSSSRSGLREWPGAEAWSREPSARIALTHVETTLSECVVVEQSLEI
jgi:hypothetical protein